MLTLIRPSLVLLLTFTVLTGVAYPALVTGIAQTLFSHRANGSPIERDGRIVGSALVGQAFHSAKYFWPRPSATSPTPYNGAASSGSNLGPTNEALVTAVKQRVEALNGADPSHAGARPPMDLVTASGSGLDPHLSPEAALFQVHRVATARAVEEAVVRELVEKHIEPRTLGVLGEPRVNVLELNLALDSLVGPGV